MGADKTGNSREVLYHQNGEQQRVGERRTVPRVIANKARSSLWDLELVGGDRSLDVGFRRLGLLGSWSGQDNLNDHEDVGRGELSLIVNMVVRGEHMYRGSHSEEGGTSVGDSTLRVKMVGKG